MNIVALVEEFFTPKLAQIVAASHQVDEQRVLKSFGAAVPVLLRWLATLTSSRDAARRLADAIEQQRANILEDVVASAGGSRQRLMVLSGLNDLTLLFDRSCSHRLVTVIDGFGGLGRPATGNVVGLIVPIVLGLLGRQLGAETPDATSLRRLMAAQRRDAMQAMPPELRDVPVPSPRRERASEPGSGARTSAGQQPRTSSSARLVWLVPLVLAASFFGGLVSAGTARIADHMERSNEPIPNATTLKTGGELRLPKSAPVAPSFRSRSGALAVPEQAI
jgi:hypothetical protein